MKKYLLFFVILFPKVSVYAQTYTAQYFKWIHLADSLYQAKNYKVSALDYSKAFKVNKGYVRSNDRYNAACSWSLANVPDSAFSNLNLLVIKENYHSYKHLTSDPDLNPLHHDKRWEPLLQKVRRNQELVESHYYKALVAELDTIYNDDQDYRQKIRAVEKQYGAESKEMNKLWDTIGKKDSVNLTKVISILDTYGWLGPDKVGEKGNLVLFLVIQHADQNVQEKYLPMMREAVKNKKAEPANLALLEDRVALGEGKKQIYGSQIGEDTKTGKYYINPIEDERNVNKRRAAVGLEPLEEYAKQWGIVYKLPSR
jgi:hypothetical protein